MDCWRAGRRLVSNSFSTESCIGDYCRPRSEGSQRGSDNGRLPMARRQTSNAATIALRESAWQLKQMLDSLRGPYAVIHPAALWKLSGGRLGGLPNLRVLAGFRFGFGPDVRARRGILSCCRRARPAITPNPSWAQHPRTRGIDPRRKALRRQRFRPYASGSRGGNADCRSLGILGFPAMATVGCRTCDCTESI
jgi:hypothetical protein